MLNDRNSELVAPGDPGAIAATIGRLAADENPAHGSDPECTGNGFTVRYGRAYPFLLSLFGRYLGFGTCRYGCLSRKRGRISCRRREAGGIDAQR
ncbi:MAG: hypothetical protein ACLR1G_09335 [Alistipes indistinctus]